MFWIMLFSLSISHFRRINRFDVIREIRLTWTNYFARCLCFMVPPSKIIKYGVQNWTFPKNETQSLNCACRLSCYAGYMLYLSEFLLSFLLFLIYIFVGLSKIIRILIMSKTSVPTFLNVPSETKDSLKLSKDLDSQKSRSNPFTWAKISKLWNIETFDDSCKRDQYRSDPFTWAKISKLWRYRNFRWLM